MNQLRQMSIFAHIVEQGSVSAAAEKLNLSKSVISQHLKALELELGVTLIKRTTRRQTLTATGESFYQRCREMNSIATAAWEQVQTSQIEPRGRIRITAPNALMDWLVTPVVAELMKSYPQLKPELISDDQQLNLMQHDIDLAIRVGPSQDSNLKQRRLGEFRDILCGHQALASLNINELPYIANHWQGKQIRHTFYDHAGGVRHFETTADCLTNTFHTCLALIKTGAGIGLIPDFYLAQLEPYVVNMQPDMQLSTNPIYALSPYHIAAPPAVALCMTAIEERLNCLTLNNGFLSKNQY